jgi:hypothetical protein
MKRYRGLVLAVAILVPLVLAQEVGTDAWVKDGLVTAEEAKDGFVPLFNGKNLDGWWCRGKNKDAYQVKEDGVLLVTGEEGGDWLFTDKEYGDFVLRYEYRCVSGEGNSGVGIRATKDGNPAFDGFEIQVLRPGWETPYQRSCALYAVQPPKVEADKPFGEWNAVEVMADGTRIRTKLNDTEVYDVHTTDFTPETVKEDWQKPANDRPLSGYIALQDHSDAVEFRKMRIKPLTAENKE